FADVRDPELALTVTAERARVLHNEDGRLDVDAVLSVDGSYRAIEITGDVLARRGVLYVPELQDLGQADVVSLDQPRTFERVDTLLMTRRDLLVERSPLLENIRVDVNVRIERDVWLRSIEANVEV